MPPQLDPERDRSSWGTQKPVVPSRDLTDDEAAAISEIQAETATYCQEDGEDETKSS